MAEDLLTNHRIRSLVLEPSYSDTMGLTRGSKIQNAELAPTIWTAELTTAPLSEADYSNWLGWLDVQRNGKNKFKLYDVTRDYPLAYSTGPSLTKAGGGAFTWTCLLNAVNVSNLFQITLSGLPANFIFTPGDYLAFDHVSATKRAFHRVSYPGVTGNGSGVATITVSPMLSNDYTLNSTVYLYRPYMVMQISPGSINYGKREVSRSSKFISLKAVQSFWY